MKGFRFAAKVARALVTGLLFGVFVDQVAADPLAETREVIFSGTELTQKAAELKTPAAMYEYVRNTHEYALYHGSRSNTLNTYGGLRGSDVDIASVLIGMYRSQGIPARYAVGTISVPAADVANWLTVRDIDLAAAIMDDQGIQGVNLTPDRQFIEFEHAWVQVQVPYDHYRGSIDIGVNCTATPSRCHWIDIDPSFKLRQFHNQGIDIYGVVDFDYDRYYNAIKNDDAAFRDKGPTEIYEAQILNYLKTNFPGKTLEDVADPGVIEPISDGLLPASLPYQVIGSVNTYDAIADHDAATGSKPWAKFLTLRTKLVLGGITLSAGGGTYALADLTTKRLTLTYVPQTQTTAGQVQVRLDGTIVATPITTGGTINGQIIGVGTPFSLEASLDGAPATQTGQTDSVITVNYDSLIVGGYYLVGTGGDTSNWSQVHRAADQLLAANDAFPILNDAGNVPFVDQNGNGIIDAGEPRLLDDLTAQDNLTGGLLQVAMTQYYTRFVENTRRLDSLNHVISPMEGFVGVVSSTYEVDYLDTTAFSVMPGGLLIDMKGVRFNGSWRNNTPATYASDHFELIGHEGSSLEHEIWQEITGFDAVSTVRGIQMAVANGAVLQKPENTGVSNNMASQYAGFQFSNSLPSGFVYTPFTVFSTQPATWTHSVSGAQMELLKRDVNASTSSQRRALATYEYNTANGLYAWVNCVNNFEDQLLAFSPTASVGAFTFCDGTVYSGQVSTVLSQIQTNYLTNIIPTFIGQTFFDFFDRAQGFNPNDHVYRGLPLATNQHDGLRIADIRDDVMIGDDATVDGVNGRWEYVIPGRKTQGDLFRFTVFWEKIFSAVNGQLASQSYSISNDVFLAGGGWVDGASTLEQSSSIPGTSVIKPTFNNEVFTDLNLVAQTNNDLIRTPSTADPISTVTGNMYHDETDFTITGRGLDYAFTRSYNSGPARADQDGPLGYGWTHSYNMSLRSNDYGVCPNCAPGTGSGQAPENGNGVTASITYIDERGGEHTYLINESTLAVTPPPGEFDTLQLSKPAAGQYTLEFRNGVKYVFSGPATLHTAPSQTARLGYIEDPYGNRLTLGYDGNGRLASVTDNLGVSGRTGLTFNYSGSNPRIQSISDWSGRSWSFGYANGNLTTITNPLNDTVTYTYHAGTHLLNERILPANRGGQQAKTTFTYYRNNKAFTNANALGEGETVDYDLYRQRTRVTDPRGFIREHFYDKDNGALTKLQEPDGAILQFANNADGLRYTKTDGLGFETRYSYMADHSISAAASNNAGLVSREVDPLGLATDLSYGLFDQPTDTVDKRGNRVSRVYHPVTDVATDAVRGKLATMSATLNGQSNVLLAAYRYYASGPAFGQLKQRIEFIEAGSTARQRITDYEYAANGIDLIRRTQRGLTAGGSIVTTYSYDALGRRTSETLSRRLSAQNATQVNLTTTFAYDALDRVIRVTNPRGDINETVYDANGQVRQEKVHYKQADGTFVIRTVATHAYDAADRRVSTTDILGNTSTFAYDAAGNLLTQTDANGHTSRFEYDSMGRRTAVIDANGHRTEMSYDLGGRLVETRDANGNATRFEYDALGRQTKVISPLGFETRTQYDGNGNVTHLIDANAAAGGPVNDQGASVYRVYDELNRLRIERDALNGDTFYVYDLLGNVTLLRDAAGQETRFVYDDLGRLIESIDPIVEAGTDKTEKVLQYDEAGNVLLTEDRLGQQTRHSYDNLNRRVLSEYLGEGSQTRWTYDGFGDWVQVSEAEVGYTYTYTARHQRASQTDSRLGRTLLWIYDAVGNVVGKADYQGEGTAYQYDSTNRLVAERSPTYLQVSYHYDGAGRLLNRILSNGAQTDYRYDADNRLIGLKNVSANGTVVEDLSYTRDRLGDITRVSDAALNGRSVDYFYDALSRLMGVNSSVNAEDRLYTYDAVGNRLSERRPANGDWYFYCYHATDCTQPPNGNRLHNIRTGSVTGALWRQYQYDAAGRVTLARDGASGLLYALSYDSRGRVTQSGGTRTGTGQGSVYGYDANDYRVRKDDRLYHLDGEHLEAVYDSTGQLQTKYLRGVVVDEIVNGYTYHSSDPNDWTNYTYHHDQLNSVTGLTGHTGGVAEKVRYDAFGAPLNLTIPGTGNELLYTGRVYDRATGLYDYRARYYDPEVGRFPTEDPIGFDGGINFYVYCNNNPINCNDPMGKLGGPFGLLNTRGALSNPDFARGSNFTNVVGLGGTAVAAAPFVAADTVGLGTITVPAEATAGAFARTALTSGTIGGTTAGLGTLVTGGGTRDVVINTGVGFGLGAVAPAFEVSGFLANAGKGAVLGGSGSTISQFIDIGTDPTKTVNDFNVGAVLGSAVGGGLTSGVTAPFGSSLGQQVSAGIFSFGPETAASAIGERLGAPSASGGFVLYPSKPNTNQLRSVYQK